MSLGPLNFPYRAFDLSFLDRKNLHLPEPLAEQFKQSALSHLESFQKELTHRRKELITFLEGDHSPEEIQRAISRTQEGIERLQEQTLQELRSELLNNQSEGSAQHIDLFLKEVKKEFEEHADFTRSEVGAQGKSKGVGASIFEVAASTSAPYKVSAPPLPPSFYENEISDLENWAKECGFQPVSSQASFVQWLANAIRKMSQARPPFETKEQVDVQLLIYMESAGGKQDIYMIFFLNSDQVSKLWKALKLNYLTPPFPETAMDKAHAAINQWLNSLKNPQDKALAYALQQEAYNLGSQAPLSSLKAWAQNLVNSSNPLFLNASSAAQAEFCTLTGAQIPNLVSIQESIDNYLKEREAEYLVLLQALGLTPQDAPKTRGGWVWLTDRAKVLQGDIAYAQRTGDWQQLAQKWGLAPGSAHAIEQEAGARLHAYQNAMQAYGAQSAVNLFTLVSQKISQIISGHGSVTDLKKWASSINLANYPDLSPNDLDMFKLIS